MSSQDSIENESPLVNLLKALLDRLAHDDDENGLIDAINDFKNNSFKYIEPKNINADFFKPALPVLLQCFMKAINQLKLKCDSASSLQLISGIVECISRAMKIVTQGSNVKINQFSCMPKIALSMVKESLLLCQENKDNIADALPKFYALTQTFVMEILNLLCICFVDNSDEYHVMTLNEVCEEIFPIVKIASKMDVKFMSSLWKVYMKLLSDHQITLKDRLDVAIIVNFLCQEITSALVIINECHDDGKASSRVIKLTSFHFKIVVMICDKYKDYLGECHQSLFHLLVTLVSFCELKSFSAEVKDELSRCLKVGIDPLIMHLISDRNFIDVALNVDLGTTQGGPLCVLYAHILPHIVALEDDSCQKWLNGSTDKTGSGTIVTAMFRTLPRCSDEFRCPLYMPGVMQEGKAQRQISFYEYVCSIICGFVAMLPDRYFKLAEEELLASVLSQSLWRSLMAADVFCFIARYGSAKLCFDYCLKMTEMLKDQFSVNLARLVSRLLKFLTPSDKKRYVDKFPLEDHATLWSSFDSDTFKILSSFGALNATRCAMEDIKKWLGDPGSVRLYISMINGLKLLTKVLGCGNGDVADARNSQIQQNSNQLKGLCNCLWRKVNNDVLGKPKLSAQYLGNVVSFTAVLINIIPSKALLQIMYMVRKILKGKLAVEISPVVIPFLGKFACLENTSSTETTALLRLVSDCYVLCLQSEDCRVGQLALESFAAFARKTSHESTISRCLKNNSNLQIIVTHFLSKVPHDVDKAPSIRKRCLNDDEKPAKKLKMDSSECVDDVQHVVNDLKDGVANLETMLERGVELTPMLRNHLVILSRRLVQFSKF